MTPLVLLHGFTQSACSFRELIAELSPEVVFAPALLGHDGTARRHGVETFDDEVDRIAELMRPLAAPAHLVGYSLGGRVARGIAARHPDLLTRVSLVSAHPGLVDDGERRARRAADARWRELLEGEGIAAFVERWEALPLFASQSEELRAAQRRARLEHDPRGLALSLEVLGLGVMPRYEVSDVPVTLVVGEHDDKFRTLAGDTAVVIEGAGHNPVLEQPRRLAQALGGGEDR